MEPLYTPADLAGWRYEERLGYPGEFPFTRGPYPSMYRGRLWTMRMFAGFGRPEDTNARFKYLLEQGQTGLSTAFDMPALMGYDADHPRARGEVGKEGVSISTLADFEILFRDIPLDRVTTSMTINCTASVALAMYLALAEKQGVAWDRVGGTMQNDMLKEFIAQKEWISPPDSAVRIVVDTIEFCAKHVPRFNPVSISGYHIREAGSTAVQELAFTLADGFAYVDAGVKRGLAVDDFAPRLSFFFDIHNDFFEEIAKLRAARRIWATVMRDRFGARKAESMRLRTHTQTAGVSATAQQPLNNVARVAIQALAAVLGGRPVAPHQLLRRGARAAHRGGGHGGAADAADHRGGVRGAPHRGPARRLLLPRAPHRRDGSARDDRTSVESTSWAAWSRPSSTATRSGRSRTPPTATSSWTTGARRRWWA